MLKNQLHIYNVGFLRGVHHRVYQIIVLVVEVPCWLRMKLIVGGAVTAGFKMKLIAGSAVTAGFKIQRIG